MKRIISIIVMFSLLLSSLAIGNCAFGEGLVLPSGLEFGMSVSQATAVSGYEKCAIKGTFSEAYIRECNYAFSTEAYLLGEVRSSRAQNS